MSHALAVVTGAVIGGVFALLGGLLLQMRAERRRMLGAGRMVVAELRRNASNVEWYFDQEVGPSSGRDALVTFALMIETAAWDTHNAELSHLIDDELLELMERLYYHLRRLEAQPQIAPNWAGELRGAEAALRVLLHRRWWDRWVWRL
jgi:hypothetical protein